MRERPNFKLAEEWSIRRPALDLWAVQSYRTKDSPHPQDPGNRSISLQGEIQAIVASTTASDVWLSRFLSLAERQSSPPWPWGNFSHTCQLPSMHKWNWPPFSIVNFSFNIFFSFFSMKRTSSFAKEPLWNDWSSHANKPLAEFKCNLNYQLLKRSSISW